MDEHTDPVAAVLVLLFVAYVAANLYLPGIAAWGDALLTAR